MTEEQFVFWFKGYVEANGYATPTEEQWNVIVGNLKTVALKTPQSLFFSRDFGNWDSPPKPGDIIPNPMPATC